MKTILIPTDFSDIAENAISYAVELSKLLQAKLVLFHAYHMPIVTTEVPMALPTQNELEEDAMAGLTKVRAGILEADPAAPTIECVVKYGLAVDEILDFAEETKVDMVVMGMRGGGILNEKLIGSVTTSLVRKTKCPVLIIDKNVHYKKVSRIVLASDYKEIHHDEALSPLKDIAKLLNAHIYVLNVVKEPAHLVPTTEEAIVGVKLEHSLEDVEHSFHYTENEDVVDGINEYVDEHQIDMVAMIPHIHNVFRAVFQEPYTKRMAFHSHVPLLILND